MKRKRYSNELKSKVAFAAIKGNLTVNEIASEYGIHVSQVNRWKKDLLFQQIGKLQVAVEFLKKTPDT